MGILSGCVEGVVGPMMEKLVIPKIQQLASKMELNYKLNLVPIENHFKEYLERTYKKLSIANTIALRNRQKELKMIYEPLIISSNRRKSDKTEINSYPKNLLEKYQKVLITDTAGMGKSTLMKRIFLDIIDNLHGIPLFIELRRLTSKKKILDEIQEQLNAINQSFDAKLLQELLAIGGFIIILDGVDEITLEERSEVFQDIQDFIEKTHNNYFFLTSRPENTLSSFSAFKEFQINPLTKEQAYNLLRKYDDNGDISALLIKKLEEMNSSGISDFLTNPFLTSLLFTAFEHKQSIPLKKHLFYRQVFDAYFESHDLSKGESFARDKSSNLSIDEFEFVLRYLAFYSFIDKQKIEYTKDELLIILEKIKNKCSGFSFEASKIIGDLITSVPLFSKDGVYYKWSHKSIFEYFTVQFIYKDAGERRNTILKKIYESTNIDKYSNILDLYYDVDYKSFSRIIEYAFLTEVKENLNTTYQHDYNKLIDPKLIEERKNLSVFKKIVLIDNNLVDKFLRSTDWEESFASLAISIPELKEVNIKVLSLIIYGVFKVKKSRREFQILCIRNKRNSLIEILYSKKVEYLERINVSHSSELPIDYEGEFPVLINDAPNSLLNSSKCFKDINEILRITASCVFNNKVFDAISRIEKEMKEEDEENLFSVVI